MLLRRIFLSKPQAWYIIAAPRGTNERCYAVGVKEVAFGILGTDIISYRVSGISLYLKVYVTALARQVLF